MHKSSLGHLLDILEIPLRAISSEHLPVLDEDQEAEDLHDASCCCDDEAVLIPVGVNHNISQQWIDITAMELSTHPRLITHGVTP
jgi:hypothetical protein